MENGIPVLDPPAVQHTAAPRQQRKKPKRSYTRRAVPERSAADTAHAGAINPGDAERAAPAREPIAAEAMPEQITRVRRDQVIGAEFTLPKHRKKPGWDYEFKEDSVLGMPTDGSRRALWAQQGWRPEKAKDWPELCPPGWEKQTVEQGNQTLYGRPLHLTIEARQEDYDAAEQQKADRLRSAADGRPTGAGVADVKGVVVKPLGLEIVGEAGTYAKKV